MRKAIMDESIPEHEVKEAELKALGRVPDRLV
jgi:OFA family oxalate/formate antiporter-like MFS transporter